MEKLLYLVRKHDFGPDETHEMAVAFQNVCAAVEDLSPDLRQYFAEQIIQLATAGEADSTRIYIKCLERYRNIASVKRAG